MTAKTKTKRLYESLYILTLCLTSDTKMQAFWAKKNERSQQTI
jgi:hypothetical protein